MNNHPLAHVSVYENLSVDKAMEASERAAAHLKNALNRMSSAKDKAEKVKALIDASSHFISYSKRLSEKQNEIINKCFDRLDSLEISVKESYVHIIKKHLNGHPSDNSVLPAMERELLKTALNAVNTEINTQTPPATQQYLEIDFKTAAETTFWCKKFNASRPEIPLAMEQIKSKSWVEVWTYFLNKKKPAAAV